MARIAKSTLVGLVLTLWLGVASHCVLESLLGLEFLRCETESAEGSKDGHGCDDGCCSVEFSKYQAQRPQELVLLCLSSIVPFGSDLAADVETSAPRMVGLGLRTAAPPHLLVAWQFDRRAALPIRAPSSVS